MTRAGNNTTEFLKFLKSIGDWPLDGTRTILVMDNATYHKTKKVKEYIKSLDVGMLFLPPSSSALNPIEYCWGVFKQAVTK